MVQIERVSIHAFCLSRIITKDLYDYINILQNMSFNIGSVKSNPGERANGYIKIFEYLDGSPILMPVIVVNGIKPGPRLWTLACEHADEVYGALIIVEAAKRMDPKEMCGTFIGIPAINTTALNFGTRHSPIDWVDIEHGYPGKEVSYFSERLTYKLFELMYKNADCVLNYHGGVPGKVNTLEFMSIQCPPSVPDDLRERNRKIAEVYGLDIISEKPIDPETWKADSLVSQRGLHPLMPMMYPQLNKKGIPAVAVMYGVGPGASPFDKYVDGIFNVMMHLDMIRGTPEVPAKYTRVSKYVVIRPTKSGIFKAHVNVGDKVKKDQEIGKVYNIFGEEIEKIVSPVDGIVNVVNTHPFINAGQYECYAFEIFW